MTAPETRRPVLRYLGSKWRIAPEIICRLPPHEIYVEPFGGSAAVLLRKPPARSEIWNDLDGELVNLFSVLRSEPGRLLRALSLTPYARREFVAAFEPAEEPVERARRLLIRSHMAHGSNSTRLDRNPGFRGDGVKGATRVAGEWAELPEALEAVVARLRGVQLESLPAEKLIAKYDSPNVLLFADPPYLSDTRSTKCKRGEGYHAYAHELTEAGHVKLLTQLTASKAMVVVSGYPSALYDEALQAWERVTLRARTQNNAPRLEVLWINPAAALTAREAGAGLFAGAA